MTESQKSKLLNSNIFILREMILFLQCPLQEAVLQCNIVCRLSKFLNLAVALVK